MLELNSLDDVRGNSLALYSIRTLLRGKNFPTFSILSGREGVGKSSVAQLIAKELDETGMEITVYNFGLEVDMEELRQKVFTMAPMRPKVFIFEELHGLDRPKQTALLNMIDTQAQNIYVVGTTTSLYRLSRPLRSRATVWEFRALDLAQMSKLLDDYLAEKKFRMSDGSKELLLRAAHGVPRDLLKNVDFIASGAFQDADVATLLGQVNDVTMFTLFTMLQAQDERMASAVQSLMEQTGQDKVNQLRDFWTRFLLESASGKYQTISAAQGRTLASMYMPEQKEMVARALLRATEETLMLELLTLNLRLTKQSLNNARGMQVHAAQENEGRIMLQDANVAARERMEAAKGSDGRMKMSTQELKTLKLGGD